MRILIPKVAGRGIGSAPVPTRFALRNLGNFG